MNACKKRPVTRAQMEGVIYAIESSLMSQIEQEVPSSVIGEMVLEQLKEVDEVAYIRFASVYQEFSDIQSFINADESAGKVTEKPAGSDRRRENKTIWSMPEEESGDFFGHFACADASLFHVLLTYCIQQ